MIQILSASTSLNRYSTKGLKKGLREDGARRRRRLGRTRSRNNKSHTIEHDLRIGSLNFFQAPKVSK
jgi:hypothetical protein